MLKNFFLILVLFTSYTFVHNANNCDEILQANPQAKSGEYTLNINGLTTKLVCNMESNCGGWTKVAHIRDTCTGDACRAYHKIDDRGLKYREVMIKTNPGHFIAYAGGDSSWYSSGFSLLHNSLRFNSHWYYYRNINVWRGCGAKNGYGFQVDFNGHWQRSSYIFNNEWRVSQWADRCFAGGVNLSNRYCASEFVVQAPGRLDGYGDLESLTRQCIGDNRINLDIEFYVR